MHDEMHELITRIAPSWATVGSGSESIVVVEPRNPIFLIVSNNYGSVDLKGRVIISK